MTCNWNNDDGKCTSTEDCEFTDTPHMLVPYVCARLSESDRDIRDQVMKAHEGDTDFSVTI